MKNSSEESIEVEIIMKICGAFVGVFILILFILSINITGGNMGYNIEAAAGGNIWSIDRFTKNITYNIESYVYGKGNFSRHNYENPVSELSYLEKYSVVRDGNLSFRDKTGFASREGPISVSYALQSSVNQTGTNPSSNDSTSVEIIESWPSYFSNQKMLSYNGKGIKTFERYDFSGDVITSSSDSWILKKNSLFVGKNNKTWIKIKATPQDLIEERRSNKKITYLLDVSSLGQKESFNIINTKYSDEKKREPTDNLSYIISQEYRGQVNMAIKITSNDTIPGSTDNDSINASKGYLPCCQEAFLAEGSHNEFLTAPIPAIGSAASVEDISPNPHIADHSMACEINESTGELIRRTSTFNISNDRVYSWLSLDSARGSHNIKWMWLSPQGTLMDISSYAISGSAGSSKEPLKVYSLLDAGRYRRENVTGECRVNILLDNKKILTEYFKLKR